MRRTSPLGMRIQELREKHDLTFRELAKKLGVSAPHLSDIEKGKRDPSPDLLAAIARVLNVPSAELEQLDPRPPVDELRKKRQEDPRFGVALRHLLDSNITAQQLEEMIKRFVDEDE